jgi:hypothetical protein
MARARAVIQTFASTAAPPSSVPVPTTDMPASSTATLDSQSTNTLALSSSAAAQEAIAKARAIVQTFQQQQQQQQQQQTTAQPVATSSSLPCDYKNRRDHYMETVEHTKFRKALVRNWNYIANKEEKRLQRQLKQVEVTKQYEIDLERKQHELQKQRQLQSTSGSIGTQPQRMRSRNKKRKKNDDEASLYLSNLPSTIDEELLRQLFSSYGTIQRIKLYRHKSTGEFKGDGLVVYSELPNEEFFIGICQQVSRGGFVV